MLRVSLGLLLFLACVTESLAFVGQELSQWLAVLGIGLALQALFSYKEWKRPAPTKESDADQDHEERLAA